MEELVVIIENIGYNKETLYNQMDQAKLYSLILIYKS